jgi:hypothetical protein
MPSASQFSLPHRAIVCVDDDGAAVYLPDGDALTGLDEAVWQSIVDQSGTSSGTLPGTSSTDGCTGRGVQKKAGESQNTLELEQSIPVYPRFKSWDLQLRLAPKSDVDFVKNNSVDLTDESVRKNTTAPNPSLFCPLCEVDGHSIATCTAINDQGKTSGCPRCNVLEHSFDDCIMAPSSITEILTENIEYLVQNRHGKPPIESEVKWEDMKGYVGTDDMWPQTAEFAKSRKERKGMQSVDELVFGIDHIYRVVLRSQTQRGSLS